MTVGETIQNLRVCTPGELMVWVVAMRATFSDVIRSHCRFIDASLAPVATVSLTICGASSSMETAYFSPSVGKTLARGDRYAQTVTWPVVNKVMVYSSRGLRPPGCTADAVTGAGVIPEPVLPMSGIRAQDTGPAPTAWLKCSASIETYPLASTK